MTARAPPSALAPSGPILLYWTLEIELVQHPVDAKSGGQRSGALVADVVAPEHEVGQDPVNLEGLADRLRALDANLVEVEVESF